MGFAALVQPPSLCEAQQKNVSIVFVLNSPTFLRESPPRTRRQIPFQISPHDSSVWIRTAGARAGHAVLRVLALVKDVCCEWSVQYGFELPRSSSVRLVITFWILLEMHSNFVQETPQNLNTGLPAKKWVGAMRREFG